MALSLVIFSCCHDPDIVKPLVQYPALDWEYTHQYVFTSVVYYNNGLQYQFKYIPEPLDDYQFLFGGYYSQSQIGGGRVKLYHHDALVNLDWFIYNGEQYNPGGYSWYLLDFEQDIFSDEQFGYAWDDTTFYRIIRNWPYDVQDFDSLDVTSVYNFFLVEE